MPELLRRDRAEGVSFPELLRRDWGQGATSRPPQTTPHLASPLGGEGSELWAPSPSKGEGWGEDLWCGDPCWR